MSRDSDARPASNGAIMAQLLLIFAASYAGIGVVFAALFLARGVHRVDHATVGAPLGFYLLVFPGVAALWPLMLFTWRRARSAP